MAEIDIGAVAAIEPDRVHDRSTGIDGQHRRALAEVADGARDGQPALGKDDHRPALAQEILQRVEIRARTAAAWATLGDRPS